MYRLTTLPNGVRVVTSTMEHVRSATLQCNFRVGSRDEADAEAGIAHFIEHLLFQGTERRRTSHVIDEEIERLGGDINASTGRETTSYYVRVPYHKFGHGFEVLSDMMRHSLFRPKDVEKEREVIVDEIRSYNDVPEEVVGELTDTLMWQGAAVGRPVAGSEGTIGAISRKALVRFWEAHYTADRLVIAAAGRITHDEVVERATAAFGDLPAHGVEAATFTAPVQTAPRVALVKRDIQQANINLSVPAVSYSDDRKYAQYLLHIILGGAASSRLYQKVREKLGLAYSIGTYFTSLTDVGWGTIYANVSPEDAEQTISVVLDELKRLRRKPITPAEFERAVQYVTGSLLMGLEGSAAVASWIGVRELLLGEILAPEEVVAKYEAVTIKDVQALANELYVPEHFNLAVVGPYDDEAVFGRLIGA